MEEVISKVKEVQDLLFKSDDSDQDGLYNDDLSVFSDLPSYPSVILEKLDFPQESSSEEEISEIPQEQPNKCTKNIHIIDEDDSLSEIPPDPPIKFAPSYAIPIKVANFLVPDLTKYSKATILILKGRDFPRTKSGVRSSYITFQFDENLPVIQTPVCYNHEAEAIYNGGFTIDISKVKVDNSLPIIEAYDIISDKHQELIGFNAIQFQHSTVNDKYLTVVENEWIQLYMPHCRKKAGQVLVSLYLHNNECPAINDMKKQVTQQSNQRQQIINGENEQEKLNIQQQQQQKLQEINNQQAQIQNQNQTPKKQVNLPNLQTSQSNSLSSIPVKENLAQSSINNYVQRPQNEERYQETQTIQPQQISSPSVKFGNFSPKQPKKQNYSESLFFESAYMDENDDKKPLTIKSDFVFNVDDNELADTLSFDVSHPFSWSANAKRKRILRFIDFDDLDYSDFPPKEEAQTQTEYKTKSEFTQTTQNKNQQSFSQSQKLTSLSNSNNTNNKENFSKTAPLKLPTQQRGPNNSETEKNDESKERIDLKKEKQNPMYKSRFLESDEYVGYSDYGLFAHKLLDDFK